MKRSLAIKLIVVIVVALLAPLLTTGCGSTEKDQALTEEAIALFHERLNAGDYDAIYEDTHQEFQDTQKKEHVVATLKQSKNDFGEFKEVVDKRISVIKGNPLQVRVAYVSKFEKTDATELFSFAKDDGTMKLSYYNLVKGVTDINPNQGAKQ